MALRGKSQGRSAAKLLCCSVPACPHPLDARSAFIAQTKFFQRHYSKHIRIADAALRECDDFLGDKSCRRIFSNFQLQSITRCHEGNRHVLNDPKLKGLISKKERYRHDMTCLLWS